MLHISKYWIYIMLSFLSFSVMSQTKEKADDWKRVIDTDYTFSYPMDWKLRQTGEMGTSFILFSPAVHPDNSFNENINLIIQDNSEFELNLAQYIDISVKQLTNFYPDLDMKYNQREIGEEAPFQRMVYSGTLQEKKLQFLQYIWVSTKKVHILTATCQASDYVLMASYLEEIMQTFRPTIKR